MGAQPTSRARHRNVEVAARRTGEKVVVAGVSTLAVLVATAGFIVLGWRLSDTADTHGRHGAVSVAGADQHAGAHGSTVYEAGGMQLTVQDVGWMSHDMFGGPAPAQNNFP